MYAYIYIYMYVQETELMKNSNIPLFAAKEKRSLFPLADKP